MKRTTTAVALAVATALFTSVVQAQETKPVPSKPGAMQHGGMGMMDEKTMAQMHERMLQMQAQMERIRKTTDPAERQKIMREHMRAMQDGMGMMRGMSGGMMMGKPGAMMGGGKVGGDPAQRQDMMERRMDMMQLMMEQMMQHQQIMEPAPAK